MNEIKVNRTLGKRVNRSLILNLIKEGPISRVEISARSGLSAASVSNLTAELIADGVVIESGIAESARGRPPAVLSLNAKAGYVAGIKVSPDSLVGVVTDLEADVMAHRTVDLAQDSTSVEQVLDLVVQLVDEVAAAAGLERSALLGVGLGLAGPVDSRTGVVQYSPFFGWRDANVAQPLAARLGLDVYLENDVNSLTIAEQWFGHGRGIDDFAVVTVGRGVGLGLVTNGRFYGGSRGGVGELGHIPMPGGDRQCTCGRTGCLEAMASDPALIDAAGDAITRGDLDLAGGEITLDGIVEAAEDGNRTAQQLLADSGRWLGAGLAIVVNLLNPQLVIVAGEGVAAGEWRLGPMREALTAGLFDTLGAETEIVVEAAGDVAWARGAACVVLGDYFKSPLYRSQPTAIAAGASA